MVNFCKCIIDQINKVNKRNNYGFMVMTSIYAVFGIISIMALSVVALLVRSNKKLQGHPSPMIANICILEAILCWNSLIKFLKSTYIVCYFQFYALFSVTTKTSNFEALKILIWSNEIIVNFIQLCTLCMNLFLCIDLILTLQSPFEVASRRTFWYKILSLFTGVIFVI